MTTMEDLLDKLLEISSQNKEQKKYYRYNVGRYCKDVLPCTSRAEAQLADCYLPLAERNALINLKLRDATEHVRRNVRNAVKWVFDQALENKLLDSSFLTATKPTNIATQLPVPKGKGRRPNLLLSAKRYCQDSYRLKEQDWPTALQQEFAAWKQQALHPPANAQAQQVLRKTSVQSYQRGFESFFGYCKNILGRKELCFKQVIDVALQKGFVEWHSVERNGYRTRSGCLTVVAYRELICAKMLAFHHFKDETAVEQLGLLQKSYQKAPPTFNKKDRISGVSYQDLLRITELEYPQSGPPKDSSGARAAYWAMRAIANLFLVMATVRGQNYREAILDRHILRVEVPSRAAGGYWMTSFRGDDDIAALKMLYDAQGQINTYQVSIPDEYTHLINEYVKLWRPLLVRQGKEECKNFFLNSEGNAFSQGEFTEIIEKVTYKWLNKAIPPHSYRHIVASEFVNERNDASTAAILLNDRIETVLREYYIPNVVKAEKARNEYLKELVQAGNTNSLTHLLPEEVENLVSKVIMLHACGKIPPDLGQALRKSFA